MCWIFGWKAYLVLQLTVMMIAGSAGIWLFYVQHQFEGCTGKRSEEWDYAQAALQGQFVLQITQTAAVVFRNIVFTTFII